MGEYLFLVLNKDADHYKLLKVIEDSYAERARIIQCDSIENAFAQYSSMTHGIPVIIVCLTNLDDATLYLHKLGNGLKNPLANVMKIAVVADEQDNKRQQYASLICENTDNVDIFLKSKDIQSIPEIVEMLAMQNLKTCTESLLNEMQAFNSVKQQTRLLLPRRRDRE